MDKLTLNQIIFNKYYIGLIDIISNGLINEVNVAEDNIIDNEIINNNEIDNYKYNNNTLLKIYNIFKKIDK